MFDYSLEDQFLVVRVARAAGAAQVSVRKRARRAKLPKAGFAMGSKLEKLACEIGSRIVALGSCFWRQFRRS